jgi:energy-coupling factor transporter transmembrane protein EcfT
VSTLLTRLARLNPTAVFLGALILVLLGFFLPGVVGGLVLLVLVLALGALAVATWPLRPATRPLRLAVLALLLVVAIIKII